MATVTSVKLIGQKAMNSIVSRHTEVRRAVHKEGRGVENRASANLAKARASTRWSKIVGPGHLTFVSGEAAGSDYLIHLNAPNAMAIEFGHAPSGVFGAGGSLGHVQSKAPEGLYILIRAAGLAGAT